MKKLFKWLLSFFKKDKELEHLKKLLVRLEEKYPLKPTLPTEHELRVGKLRKEMDFISGK